MTSDEQTRHSDGDSRSDRNGYRSGDRHGDGRGNRPRYDRGYRGGPRRDGRSGGDRGHRSYGDRSEGRGDRRSDDRGYRPRREYAPREDSERKKFDGERSEGGRNQESGERGYRPRRDGRSGGERGHRPYGDRSEGRREYRPREDRGYRHDCRDDRGRDNHYSREGGRPRYEEPEERPRLTIPDDVVLILRKGGDCEINGRSDLAQILYLHGAARLNGGCENSLLRMLNEAGKDQFSTIRGRMKKECPEEILPVFDYLCSTIDREYDLEGVRVSAAAGNPFAIQCMMRMGEIGPEDEMIDLYAQSIDEYPEMIVKGLEMLVKKPGSPKARKYLDDRAARIREKETIRTFFKRILKGDESAVRELDRLAETYPEAVFLRGYVDAYRAGEPEAYVREGFEANAPVIYSYLQELKLEKSPYSMYLAAMKLKFKGEQWVPAMVEAVKAGSDDALDAISDISDRKNVRGPLQAFYFAKGDIESLALAYDGKDSKLLDKYCNGEADRILQVGKILGGTKEVHWLSKCYREGCVQCRDALVEISKDFGRYGKPLIYALHDAGADIEAAQVYFDMLGDPSLPSVKWLAKVCRNEEAKEFVRKKFEEMDDLMTFEDIFVDDGYVPKYKMKDSRLHNRRRY